ncbi:MAG: TolC family protein [Thermoguttaceae bacterium]
MRRHIPPLGPILGATLLLAAGCHPQQPFYFHDSADLGHYVGVATQIEYPDTETVSLDEVERGAPPLTLENPKPDQIWELTLEEAVRYALENGTVLRSLGGVAFGPTGAQGTPSALLQNPAYTPTTFMPALEEANPRTGTEAALAAFDAQLAASVYWEKNDTPNNIAGFFTRFRPQVFQQDLGSFQAQISKFTATGSQFSIAHNVQYEWNNVPIFPDGSKIWASAWTTNLEAQFRHPFMQGAGVAFNRIAGPGAIPGFNNGVIIARLRVDQSLADFEGSVRNFVADVERAYWNLYYAYRRLYSAIEGRNATLEHWRKVYAKYITGAREGTAQEEAQARHQYYLFAAAVHQAQTNLYKTERILRYMIGLAAADGRLIYPKDEPTTAWVPYNWDDAFGEALVRNVELRKQKWRIKQAEMELIAAKNWLLPRLDAVGRYRWLGLGDELIDPDRDVDPLGRVTDAYSAMTSGNFQEWQLGLELRLPFGFRREMAGVRHAQLSLARERKILQEQELELQHQLADALGEMSMYHELAKAHYNRWAASVVEVENLRAMFEVGKEGITLDLVLDGERRKAEAENEYYRALIDYNLAIMQVEFRKGSLLEYNGVYLAEGPWPAKAYFDARRRARARNAAHYINYGFTQPKVLSRGPMQQHMGEEGLLPQEMGLPEEGPTLAPPPVPEGAQAPEEVPAPKPAPEAMPGGADKPQSPQPSEVPAPDQAQRNSRAARLATKAKPGQNGRSPRDRYDLGSLDLSGLAGKPAEVSPPPADQPSQVQKASYQQAGSPTQGHSPKSFSVSWTAPEPSATIGQPAPGGSPASGQPASGWKPAQR